MLGLLTLGIGASGASVARAADVDIGFLRGDPVTLPGEQSECILADMNGDGDLDLVTGGRYHAQVWVFLGDGDGGFGEPTGFDVANVAVALTAGDLDGDGKDDIVVTHQPPAGIPGVDPDELSVLMSGGAGGPHQERVRYDGDNAGRVAIVDLDGDDVPDLVTASHSAVWVAYGDGAGGFDAPVALFPTADFQYGASTGTAAVDFDEDGDLDLVFTGALGTISMLRNDGSLNFTEWRTLSASSGPTARTFGLVVADLDDDDHVDYATFDGAALITFYGDGTGEFTEAQFTDAVSSTPGHLSQLVAADFDQDGILDFAFGGGGAILRPSVLRNVGDRTFEGPADFTTVKTDLGVQTWASWIAAGEIDDDPMPDFVTVDLREDIANVFLGSPGNGPSVTSISPNQALPAETLALELTGTDFDPAAVVALAPGFALDDFTVESSTTVSIAARSLFPLPAGVDYGETQFTVTNPDERRSTVAFTLVQPPTPVVTVAAPGTGVAASTLDVVLTGADFASNTDVSFGAGITVNTVTVDDSTQLTVNVSIDAGAVAGPRNVTVTNSMTGLSQVGQNIFGVTLPATIDVLSVNGRIRSRRRVSRDQIKLTAFFAFNGFSPDGAFSSATDAVTVRIGIEADPIQISIPANDPGWTVVDGKNTWKSPRSWLMKVRVVIDTDQNKFVVNLKRVELAVTPSNEILVELVAGDDSFRELRPVQLGGSRSLRIQ